jgi:hypothetical protein
VKKNKKKNPARNFGILFFIVFFLYGAWPIINSNELKIWSLLIGILFLIFGLFFPKVLLPLNNIWIKFGELLGKIISPLVMGIVFFVFITPMAFIIRLFGKDLLNMKFNSKSSYWINRKKNITSMKKQF